MKLATKIKRFEKLREWVRAEPRRYNQRVWAATEGDLVNAQNPPCGTVACLAGNAVLMEGFKVRYDEQRDEYRCIAPASRKQLSIHDEAKRLLGLSENEADDLFGAYGEGWDQETRQRYHFASTIQARAAAAIAELDIRIAAMRRQLKRRGNIEVPRRA